MMMAATFENIALMKIEKQLQNGHKNFQLLKSLLTNFT